MIMMIWVRGDEGSLELSRGLEAIPAERVEDDYDDNSDDDDDDDDDGNHGDWWVWCGDDMRGAEGSLELSRGLVAILAERGENGDDHWSWWYTDDDGDHDCEDDDLDNMDERGP